MTEERLQNIETKIAFLEDNIDELNKLVYLQQKKLAQLESICISLLQQMQTLEEAGGMGMSANVKPPHY